MKCRQTLCVQNELLFAASNSLILHVHNNISDPEHLFVVGRALQTGGLARSRAGRGFGVSPFLRYASESVISSTEFMTHVSRCPSQ